MSELLGIIVQLKKFMSNSNEEIQMVLENEKRTVLSLGKDRVYNIPDFQREIRWTNDNIAILIDDVKEKSRFLGNIILTKHSEENFSIIDGQQRITILTMILNCIRKYHEGEIEILTPCKLTIESFEKFYELMEADFSEDAYTDDVIKSDKLNQIKKYTSLWKYISDLNIVRNKREAKRLLEKIKDCSFNVIINEADDMGDGIRYFIDVNLKGKQLDIEDIFKSYLFRNDSSKKIRDLWYTLKKTVAEVECSKMNYTILRLLEHYFQCDLYNDDKFKGMEFDTDFLLKKEHKDKVGNLYREGTHFIELVDANEYMRKSLVQLNEIVQIMLEIVNSSSITVKFKNNLLGSDNNIRIDDQELKIIHNITGKILKDKKILPKALIIKYFLTLNYGKTSKNKQKIRAIYGIYLFSVLFTIFENKKSSDVLINIIKAKEDEWYHELIKQIEGYFSLDRITDARLLAQYKFAQNEDEEDQRFRCKSLATVYNYFVNMNGIITIRKGKLKELYQFVMDDETYSIEHFIISESKERSMLVEEKIYTIDGSVYKKYVNNFFNFIFVRRELNSRMKNYWLPQKIKILEDEEITCEYSKMILDKTKIFKKEFLKRNDEKYKDNFDLFFARDFKDIYLNYARHILSKVICRINDNV